MPSPLPPGLLDQIDQTFPRINYVTDAWANPCDAPLYVYVETAVPVALDMAVAYFCFDISDLIRWIFRPAGLWPLGGRRGRPGRRGGRPRRGIGSRVRSRLPLLQKIKGRQVSNGVKNLWRLDEIGQRFLYWWMVADVSQQGVFNFTSIMYKTAWCQLSAAASRAAATDTGAEIGGAVPETILWTDVDYAKGDAFIFGGTVRVGPGKNRIIAGVDGTEHPGEGETYELIISVIGGPQAGTHVIDSHDNDPEEPKGLVGDLHVTGEVDCFVQVRVTPSGGYKNYTAYVTTYSETPIEPPDQMDCRWENYFQFLPDGTIERLADKILPDELQEWWDALPPADKA